MSGPYQRGWQDALREVAGLDLPLPAQAAVELMSNPPGKPDEPVAWFVQYGGDSGWEAVDLKWATDRATAEADLEEVTQDGRQGRLMAIYAIPVPAPAEATP